LINNFKSNDNKNKIYKSSYNIINITKDNKLFISILKYNFINKNTPTIYELINKYNNIIYGNILDLTNMTLHIEALKYYVIKNNIKNIKLFLHIPLINTDNS